MTGAPNFQFYQTSNPNQSLSFQTQSSLRPQMDPQKGLNNLIN